MMETQSDQKIRVVALSNLRAMCERVSSTYHRYSVVSVSRSRVHVEYSNPDEYGNEHPMTAVFPNYTTQWPKQDEGTPFIVLDILRVLHDNCDGEGWQAFEPLLGCPTLWRSPVVEHPGVPDRWETHHEINVRLNATPIDRVDSCTVCDLPVAYEAFCNACGWKEQDERQGVLRACVAAHTCTPSEHGIARTPDVTVRAITRSEAQS